MSQTFTGTLTNTPAGGISNTTTYGITYPMYSSRAAMWGYAAFGFSTTVSTAGATFGVALWSNVVGASVKIAEITGIMGMSRFPLLLVNESTQHVVGATQSASSGVLHPISAVFTGVSAGVGLNFGGVVTAALYRA